MKQKKFTLQIPTYKQTKTHLNIRYIPKQGMGINFCKKNLLKEKFMNVGVGNPSIHMREKMSQQIKHMQQNQLLRPNKFGP